MTKSGKHCGKRRNCTFWVNFSHKKICSAFLHIGKGQTNNPKYYSTFSIKKTLSDASAADRFLKKHVYKRRNCSKQFLILSPCFQLLYFHLKGISKRISVCFQSFLLQICCVRERVNAFWRLYGRRLFENIVTKEEIAQNVQFLLLPQCFPLLVIVHPFNYRDFLCFDKIRSKSSAAELSYEGKG